MAAGTKTFTYVIEKLSPAMLLNILVCLEEQGSAIEYNLKLFQYKNESFCLKISQDQKDILDQYFKIKRLSIIKKIQSGFINFEELLCIIIKSLYINRTENKIKALYMNFFKRNDLERDTSGYIKIACPGENKRKACFKHIIGILTKKSDFQRIRFLSYNNIILIFYLNPTNLDFLHEIRKYYLDSPDVNLYYSPYSKFGEYEINLFLEYDLSEHPFIEKLKTLKYFDRHLVLISRNQKEIHMELFNSDVMDNLLVLGSFGSYGFTSTKNKSSIKNITEENLMPLDYVEVPVSLRNKDEYLRRLKAHVKDDYKYNDRKNELSEYYPTIPEEAFLIMECSGDLESVKEDLSFSIKQVINMLDDEFMNSSVFLKDFQIMLKDYDGIILVLIHLNNNIINKIGINLVQRCFKLKFPGLRRLDQLSNKVFARIFVQHNYILRPDIKHFSSNYLEFIKRVSLKRPGNVMLLYKSQRDKALIVDQKWFDKKSLTLFDYLVFEMKNLNYSLNDKRNKFIRKVKQKFKLEKSYFPEDTMLFLKDLLERAEEDFMLKEIDSLFQTRKELWDIIYKRGAMLDQDIIKYDRIISSYEQYISTLLDFQLNMNLIKKNLSIACNKIIDMQGLFDKKKANAALIALKGNPLGINIISDKLFGFLRKKKLKLPSQHDITAYVFTKLNMILTDVKSSEGIFIRSKDLKRLHKNLSYFRDMASEIIIKIDEILGKVRIYE